MEQFIETVTIIFKMHAVKVLMKAINLELTYDYLVELIYQFVYSTKDTFISKELIDSLCKKNGLSYINGIITLICASMSQKLNMDLADVYYNKHMPVFMQQNGGYIKI